MHWVKSDRAGLCEFKELEHGQAFTFGDEGCLFLKTEPLSVYSAVCVNNGSYHSFDPARLVRPVPGAFVEGYDG